MYITYQNTADNLRALAAHQYKISPSMRRDRWFVLAVAAIIFGLLFLVCGSYTPEVFLFCLIVTGATTLGILTLHRRTFIRQTLQAHEEGARNGFLGRIQTLSVTDSELMGVSVSGRSRLPYWRIARIDTSGKCTFIYLNAVTALMLSESATIEGDYQAFIKELRERWRQSVA